MPRKPNEAKVFLALQAIQSSQKISLRRAAQIYEVPRVTLARRARGTQPQAGRRDKQRPLTEPEEEEVIRHVIDLDARGFSPRIDHIRDMANRLRETRGALPIGKRWAYRFVKSEPRLKTRLSRAYDLQRALCEDPELIKKWFELVKNMRAKYGIQDCDFYNFDETGFMMGVISGTGMVVTSSERKGRAKKLQPGNREWVTAIECVSADGFVVPPMLVVQGKHHLASWYTDGGLPGTWPIRTSTNGWTDNNTGMEWIKHFHECTDKRRQGAWRMLVLDGHESHLSDAFETYCQENNIITLCLPPHSSHITQPLDVGCFSVLKRMYGREIEDFIKASVTHITKLELFHAFKAAHDRTMTPENVRAGFKGSGLVPFNPEAVISKLDVKLRTPTPTGPPPADADPWVSQTPCNPAEAISQSTFVRNRIAQHQGSSPTTIFSAVMQMATGSERIAHELTLLKDRVQTLEKANKALSKRRRAKRTRIQEGGTCTGDIAEVLIAKKEAKGSKRQKRSEEEGNEEAGPSAPRRCGNCGKTGHNVRTCQEVEETSDEDNDIESN
jgi:hypothetical protein